MNTIKNDIKKLFENIEIISYLKAVNICVCIYIYIYIRYISKTKPFTKHKSMKYNYHLTFSHVLTNYWLTKYLPTTH